MLITERQSKSLSAELDAQLGPRWPIDFRFELRDYIYNQYHGILSSSDGATWNIEFDDPKYETLFKIKHP